MLLPIFVRVPALEFLVLGIKERKRLLVLWVDLRTAFPSLNRSPRLHRMFRRGIGLGLCRMMLAILDLTSGIVCIGQLVGKPFQELLGVREGAVESPHAFSMYIGGLRTKLESAHPYAVCLESLSQYCSTPMMQHSLQTAQRICNSSHHCLKSSETSLNFSSRLRRPL